MQLFKYFHGRTGKNHDKGKEENGKNRGMQETC